MNMTDFQRIHDAEGYFEFFDIAYDETVIRQKRSLILKAFGDRIKTAQAVEENEQELLAFFRYVLQSVYNDFESGAAPEAHEIWGIKEGSGGCFACSIERTCDTNESSCSSGRE